jgi:DnaJ-class molecular chaperone
VLNYYEILQISSSASAAEIKQSFRALALRYHPDKNKNSEESKLKFMQLVEAYEVLSDQQARRNYDSATYMGTVGHMNKRRWAPSADFDRIYSYSELKRQYRHGKSMGGMWDISERTSTGLWKATMILFGALGAMVIFIILSR